MMALTMAFCRRDGPKAKTGSAMGLLGTMSAIGTALGPSLGGVLIAASAGGRCSSSTCRSGVLTLVLAYRYLPVERASSRADRARLRKSGRCCWALHLAAYALAMTIGRGSLVRSTVSC
jgi:predicted MFS family arabinose efflux permease